MSLGRSNREQQYTDDCGLTDDLFGSAGAASYDIEASMMPRRYKYARATQNAIVCSSITSRPTTTCVVIDLGCGTAIDGIDILSKAPNAIYIGIDKSTYMLAQAAIKYSKFSLEERGIFLKRDIFELTAADIYSVLCNIPGIKTISSVISAMTLHHYDKVAKTQVYKLAFNLLPVGGLMVLTDLYLNRISSCNKEALRIELRDIRNTLQRLSCSGYDVDVNSTTVSEYHYTISNKPQPISTELSMLNDIGFVNIDVLYRYGQLGVMVAEK